MPAKPSRGATAPAQPARPKPRRRKARPKPAAPAAGGVWSWQTPDEGWKLRWALGLLILLCLGVACCTGEIRWQEGRLKAGLRSAQGRIQGIQWRWGESPRRWNLP